MWYTTHEVMLVQKTKRFLANLEHGVSKKKNPVVQSLRYEYPVLSKSLQLTPNKNNCDEIGNNPVLKIHQPDAAFSVISWCPTILKCLGAYHNTPVGAPAKIPHPPRSILCCLAHVPNRIPPLMLHYT